ncbi:MAG TPA: glycosyltransferase [Vicinamibacterales bacterium]|nr:glycosyltransferase [Vicinamibacterales bacterium]
MTLGILYHMPFWQAADGTLWEAEGSFARYVDSLAPYFDEIVLSVPVFDRPQSAGSRVRAGNVRLAPLPYFPGPRQFYPMLPRVYGRLKAWVEQCDVIHLRVPTPAAIFAFRAARALGKPVFLLVVGDYKALLPHLPYRGIKKTLFGAYVAFEEWALRHMTVRALTFANGAALRRKHEAQGARVVETKTTTLSDHDINSREDVAHTGRIRALTVSRIDPRKGLRALPAAVAELVSGGFDISLDIVGPPIGLIGDAERDAIRADAEALAVGDRVHLAGAVPLDRLMRMYRDYDLFILPTQPGEGIPRVLLEAMANGLPVVTTEVSGITSLITGERNGILIPDGSPRTIAAAVARLLRDGELRRALIQGGYATAKSHTLERQASEMMSIATRELGLTLAAKAQPRQGHGAPA